MEVVLGHMNNMMIAKQGANPELIAVEHQGVLLLTLRSRARWCRVFSVSKSSFIW